MTLTKYPKTFHLPWSPGTTSDDRILKTIEPFQKLEMVVVTEKMDGENTTMYSNHIHARSLDSVHHPSRTAAKQLHGRICNDIPKGWRLCGENVYAKHSIFYNKLTDYFYLFSIWDQNNRALPWDETKDWAKLLGLKIVPELYIGPWDEQKIKECWTGISKLGGEQEGYVVRNFNGFPYGEFYNNVCKYVRAKHVRTSQFWMTAPVVKNLLDSAS